MAGAAPPARAAMEVSPPLGAVADACSQLKRRDRTEADAFRDLVQGYEFFLNKSAELEQLCGKKDKEIELLKEHRDALAETLHQTTETSFKSEIVKSLEDKIGVLQSELVECYRNNSELSKQVLQVTNGLQATREDIQLKQSQIEELMNDLENKKVQIESLEETMNQMRMAVEVSAEESSLIKGENLNLQSKIKNLEKENETLIERWIKLKLEEADHLNEANAMYEDMMTKSTTYELVKLARQRVNGIVQTSDASLPRRGDECIFDAVPTETCHMFKSHDGGCSSLCISKIHGRRLLFTGGNDQLVKLWNLDTATLKDTLRGALGPVLDLSISEADAFVLGGSSDGKAYMWDLQTLRIRHVLSGHTEKVVSVSLPEYKRNTAMTASYDRSIKVWDLFRGYVLSTLLFSSQCNSVVANADGDSMFSGHADGRIRMWDRRSNRLTNDFAAHSNGGITCLRMSANGQRMLSCGKGNEIHSVDIRTWEIVRTYRADGFAVSTNWHKIDFGGGSLENSFVVSGSVDGSVFVWDADSDSSAPHRVLKDHKSPVVVCSWPKNGPLVTADKLGFVRIWK